MSAPLSQRNLPQRNLPHPLPREEEQELLTAWVDRSDKSARAGLAEANIRFVRWWLWKRGFHRHPAHDDLLQEGVVGLMSALDKWDIEKGAHVITYAHWWILQKVSRFLARERKHQANRVRQVKRSDFGRWRPYDPNNGDAIESGLHRIEEDVPLVDQQLEGQQFVRWAKSFAHDKREKELVRWITQDDTPRVSLSPVLGLSRERVRQIEEGMLARMRKSKSLRDHAPAPAEWSAPAPRKVVTPQQRPIWWSFPTRETPWSADCVEELLAKLEAEKVGTRTLIELIMIIQRVGAIGSVSVSGLADALGVTKGSVTHRVNRLHFLAYMLVREDHRAIMGSSVELYSKRKPKSTVVEDEIVVRPSFYIATQDVDMTRFKRHCTKQGLAFLQGLEGADNSTATMTSQEALA